jgi:hypothetical protein
MATRSVQMVSYKRQLPSIYPDKTLSGMYLRPFSHKSRGEPASFTFLYTSQSTVSHLHLSCDPVI